MLKPKSLKLRAAEWLTEAYAHVMFWAWVAYGAWLLWEPFG